MKTLLPTLAILLLLQSCSSNEIGNSKDVNPDAIYTSYYISYAEGDESVRVTCQFRFAGKNGTTLVLTSPASIDLDGNKLQLDSGAITGAYYGTDRPFRAFAGNHTIVYTDINGKTYQQNFAFVPFKLASAIPADISGADLPLTFDGLKNGDIVHVEIADTALSTSNIDETDTIANNQVVIIGSKFSNLKEGPLEMSIYRDFDTPLDNPTKEGGILNTTYKLKNKKTLLRK